MTEHDPSFKNFVTDNYLRISIALAIQLIRSKPPDLNIITHVKNVQADLIQNNSQTQVTCFESTILKRLQANSLSEVVNLIPRIHFDKGADRDCLLEKVNRVFELPAVVSNPQEFDDFNFEDTDAKENALFIQFMVRLRTALLSSNAIRINVDDSFKSDEDSGFDSSRTTESSCLQLKYISSGLLSHVAYSPINKSIILKSVDSAMNHILNIIHSSPDEYFYFWKDSVLEEYIFIIEEAATIPDVSDCISVHLKNALQELWNNNLNNDVPLLEKQILLISKMFFNCHIIINLVQFISSKLSGLIEEKDFYKELPSSLIQNEVEALASFEKLPLFLQMVVDLLKKFYFLRGQGVKILKKGTVVVTTPADIQVSKLWQSKMSSDGQSDQEIVSPVSALHSEDSLILDTIEHQFENILSSFSKTFPLVSHRVSFILSEIKMLKKKFLCKIKN